MRMMAKQGKSQQASPAACINAIRLHVVRRNLDARQRDAAGMLAVKSRPQDGISIRTASLPYQ